MKHSSMRILRLFVTSYWLQNFMIWHWNNGKYFLINKIWWIASSNWSCDFFEKHILVLKLHIILLPNLLLPNLKFVASGGIPRKELQTIRYFPENPYGHILDVIRRPHLSTNILNVSILTSVKKMFLLNFWGEFKKLLKKISNISAGFSPSGKFPLSTMNKGCDWSDCSWKNYLP